MPPRGLADQSPTLTAPSPVLDGTAVTTPSPNGNGPASAKVQVHLLGTPTVTLGDRSLSISRRKVRALFFRLAAASEPVPREHLSFLFWPDMREATARRNLTGLLSHLRRALPDPDLLVAGDDHVWLESALFWSDALALEALQADQTQSPAHVCQRVVDLYRGSFLAGFSLGDSPEFESWVTLERSNWEQRYLASLGTLVERASGTGEYEVAVNLAHRYLEADDLAEDVHRRLIEIYAAMGDRHEAVRQYERCVEILERELGVEPLPETEAVYRAAVDGTLVSVVAQAEPLWTAVPSLDLPLVERDGLLSELEMAFSRVRSGHGAVVLLSGESGIGKTRLIQEFARRLEGRANLLAGSAYPHGQAIPYQPLVDALRPALSNNPSWMEVAACCFDELELLMPDLHALHGRLTHRPRAQPNTSGEAGRTRTRLFEALCQLILGMATGPHPLVLFLDDLHWADGTTLDWLAFLGRRLRGVPLLVVGTYNSEESGQVAGLRQSLARERILSEFELLRLERESILAILGSLEQLVPADDSLADLLQQATGGNPFYLFETIQALVESACDIDELGGMASFCLPDAIREAVEGRTARLSARTHQVLEAGAVLGPLFTFDQVHMTAGRQEMETMDGLDELVARQFLLEEDSEYRFRHEVIRAAVYRALGSGRRRLLHRRAGETLERLRTGDEPAMARHFDRAGEAGRAAFHSLEAGREAKAVFGHEEARRHFDRALVLLDQQAATLRRPEAVAASQDLRIEALFERGWVLRLLGEMEAYAADLEEEARLAERLGDPSTLAHLRYRQAYAHRWFCRYEQALAAAEDGLRLSREADNPLHKALCTREIGMVARETGDYDRAQAALDEARGALAGLGETVLHLHTIGSLSTLSLQQGNYQRGIDLARQALAICDRAGLPYERRLPLGDMGAAAGALGQAGQAQEALEQSLKIARQISDRTQEIICLGHLGWLSVRLGQAEQALQSLGDGLALAQSIGSCAEQSWLQAGLAEAHLLAGRHNQAEEHARLARELAVATGRAPDRDRALEILGRLDAGR